MIRKVKAIWVKVGIVGYDHCNTPHDFKTVSFMNRVSLISMLLMLVFTLFNVFFGDIMLMPVSLFFGFVFLGIPYLNYKGNIVLARHIVSFLSPIIIMFVTLCMDKAGGDKYFLFVASVIPLIVFRERFIYFSYFIFNIIIFYFISYYQDNCHPLILFKIDNLAAYYFVNVTSVFVISYATLHHFILTNESYEKLLVKKNEILSDKNKEINDSISYARRIQFTLLANDELLNNNLPEHFVFFKPKDIVSGDFYWGVRRDVFSEIGSSNERTDNFYICVADCTGHGVPGAFMSLLSISFLNEAINEKHILETDAILNYVRERLIEEISQEGHRDGMDGVLLRIERDPNTKQIKRITYSGAFNSPLLIRNKKVIDLPVDKMPIGKGEIEKPFTLNVFEHQPEDCLYLYSDGFADQFGGPKGKKFKYKQLEELLAANTKLPMTQQELMLDGVFNSWKGNLEQVDDVLLVGLKF